MQPEASAIAATLEQNRVTKPSEKSACSSWFYDAFSFLCLVAILTSPARTQTYTVIYSVIDLGGTNPYAMPVQGRDGNLYGTLFSFDGGNGGVYKITPSGRATSLHSFSGFDGAWPYAGLTLGTDGNFYGTTQIGGNTQIGGRGGLGVLYRITPRGTLTVLHNFQGGSDGQFPMARPIEASDGNLWGTAQNSDATGTILYKYTPSGQYVTYDLGRDVGAYSEGPLLQATDGHLYGTTSQESTIFKVSLSGTLLATYTSCGVGCPFNDGLIQATNGSFYGTAENGGSAGIGTVFGMTESLTGTIVYNIGSAPGQGCNPFAGVTEGTDGFLYSATFESNCTSDGTLFRVTTSGSYSLLHAFTGSPDGSGPLSSPLQHTNGNFYGTTDHGGAYNSGSIYRLDMRLRPFVTFVLPTGKVGQTVQILGQGLTGTTKVTFNGTDAVSFKVVSDTFLTAVVPAGATTGGVVVTTPGGALNSNKNFTISTD